MLVVTHHEALPIHGHWPHNIPLSCGRLSQHPLYDWLLSHRSVAAIAAWEASNARQPASFNGVLAKRPRWASVRPKVDRIAGSRRTLAGGAIRGVGRQPARGDLDVAFRSIAASSHAAELWHCAAGAAIVHTPARPVPSVGVRPTVAALARAVTALGLPSPAASSTATGWPRPHRIDSIPSKGRTPRADVAYRHAWDTGSRRPAPVAVTIALPSHRPRLHAPSSH